MGSPTIAVLTDVFTTRAVTPTGATTGSYGAPNSSWGVGNGWIDHYGSTGATPGNGWNITSAGATTNLYNTYAYLHQDPALTQTPNQRIVATTTGITLSSSVTYFSLVRCNPSTDGYALVLSSTQVYLAKITGGNNTVTTLGTPSSVTPTSGHVYTIDLQATGDGATTTSLTGVVKDITASTTLATVTATDTSQELQSGGKVGIACYNATGSGTLSFSQAVVYSDTALPFTTQYIGFLGDSLTYGLSTTLQTVPDMFCRVLSARSTNVRYVPVNMGFSGATTALWQNGNSSGYMAAFIQNCNALGCKTILTTLGSNDALQSVTAATWLTNMQAIITYVNSQISNAKIIFNFPPYLDWVRFNLAFGSGSAATLPLLRTYNYAALTGCTIGDTVANQTFANVDFYGLTDGGHPSDQGVATLMFLWVLQFMQITNLIGPPTSSTIQFQGH